MRYFWNPSRVWYRWAMCTKRQRFSFRRSTFTRKKLLILVGIGFCLAFLYVIFLRRKKTPTIFVIEEHHEALAYWFHAVDLGLIPKQGNVLIHIDGHSDESTPEYVTGMPQFSYPRDGRELSYFLQKNDVFIQGAVMTGLIARFIWIWPSWDARFMHEKAAYESRLIELGWYSGKDDRKDNPDEHEFCQCETLLTPLDKDENEQEKDCSYLNSTATTAEQQVVHISSHLCHIETSYISEHVNENHFLSKIKHEHDWIKGHETVILDIDEDYFGCENVANSLTQDSLSWSVIETINQHLEPFLCPKFVTHEDVGNRFLKQLLQPFLKNCKSEFKRHDCFSVKTFTELLTDAYNILVPEFLSHPSLFCGQNDFNVRDAWKPLAKIFYELPLEHLRRIYTLGFCLSTTPKTLFFEEGRAQFIICHGLNPPNATLVFLHSPDETEILNHSKLLLDVSKSILQRRPLPLVTLCRSVRDGFTPRELADFIESKIIEALNQILDEEWEINYDDDLLGGKLGWKSRS